jgi:predicted RNase H-like HicB family nuclease
MTRKYWAIFEWSGKNFSGYTPDVPGCIATAKTRDGIRRRLKGALESHLDWLQDDGEAIPEASATVRVDMSSDPEFPNPKGYFVHVEQVEVKVPKKKRLSGSRKTHSQELVAA